MSADLGGHTIRENNTIIKISLRGFQPEFPMSAVAPILLFSVHFPTKIHFSDQALSQNFM
jgi:hypothetical protein